MASHAKGLRWSLAVLASSLVHLAAILGTIVVWSPEHELPRIVLHDVVGVPVAPVEQAQAGRAQADPPSEPPSPPPPPSPPSPPPDIEPPDQQESPPPADPSAQLVDRPPLEQRPEGELPPPAPEPAPPAEETPPPTPPAEETPPPTPPAEETPSPRPEDATEGEERPLPEKLLSLPGQMGSEGGQLEKVLVDGSRVVIFMRTEQLALSPSAGAARQAMRAVAGYDLYLGQSAFDPLTDFRWVVVRSPDLTSRTNTRLLAELAVDAGRARASVERIAPEGRAIDWREQGALSLGTLQATGEEDWSQIAWAVVDGAPEASHYVAGPRPWVQQVVEDDAPEAAGGLGQGSPLEELASVMVEGEPAELVAVTSRLQSLLAAPGTEGPEVQGLVIAARLREDSLFVARLWFSGADEARQFALGVRDGLAALQGNPFVRMLNLEALIARLELHQRGEEVTAWVRLEPDQASRLLRLVAVILQAEGRGQAVVRVQSN